MREVVEAVTCKLELAPRYLEGVDLADVGERCEAVLYRPCIELLEVELIAVMVHDGVGLRDYLVHFCDDVAVVGGGRCGDGVNFVLAQPLP